MGLSVGVGHQTVEKKKSEKCWIWRVYKYDTPSESSFHRTHHTATHRNIPFLRFESLDGMATSIGFVDGTSTESALIFLGSGCSSMVPNVMCLLQPSDPPCPVCVQSLSIPPERNPNYRSSFLFFHFFSLSRNFLKISICRCNTSLLIDYCGDANAGDRKYILIDVGKTFRETVLRWFVAHRIPRVDSVSSLFLI